MKPGKYFVSHAYADRVLREGFERKSKEVFVNLAGEFVPLDVAIDPDHDPVEQLRKTLPSEIQLFLFPPIEVSPWDFVSNPLIEAILACDGVIVLSGGKSEQSFWVGFERGYALRAGKPVYVFDPPSKQISQVYLDPDAPLQLPLSVHSFGHGASDIMNGIISFMATERFFDQFPDRGGWQQALNTIEKGGYLVVFISNMHLERIYQHVANIPLRYGRNRVMLALVDECVVPESYNPNLVIRLYVPEMTSQVSSNSIDDLIVRLYWMIFRNVRGGSTD